jgi:hypothetical protein
MSEKRPMRSRQPSWRALNEGTATAGGHLVPTPLAARVIDLIRNASVVNRVGATTVPMMTSTLKIPAGRLHVDGDQISGFLCSHKFYTDVEWAPGERYLDRSSRGSVGQISPMSGRTGPVKP